MSASRTIKQDVSDKIEGLKLIISKLDHRPFSVTLNTSYLRLCEAWTNFDSNINACSVEKRKKLEKNLLSLLKRVEKDVLKNFKKQTIQRRQHLNNLCQQIKYNRSLLSKLKKQLDSRLALFEKSKIASKELIFIRTHHDKLYNTLENLESELHLAILEFEKQHQQTQKLSITTITDIDSFSNAYQKAALDAKSLILAQQADNDAIVNFFRNTNKNFYSMIFHITDKINKKSTDEPTKQILQSLKDNLLKAYDQTARLTVQGLIDDWEKVLSLEGSPEAKKIVQFIKNNYGSIYLYPCLWEEAIKAKNYARSIILKGCSQLENNELSAEQFQMLNTAVLADMRALYGKRASDSWLSGLIPANLADYEGCIKISHKYSLGNCIELSLHALDYFLTQIPEKKIRVEIFHILGGDHTFLVIGRENGSDPQNPLTWGEDALICDPWSNIVFTAAEYLHHLKNFKREVEGGRYVNVVEDFNKSQHCLAPRGFSTDNLAAHRKIEVLRENFNYKLASMENVLMHHARGLNALALNLVKEFGYKDKQVNTIILKINEINKLQCVLEEKRQLFNAFDNNCDFRLMYQQCRGELRKLTADVVNALNFSQDDKDILYPHRNPNSYTTKILRFFNAGSSMQRKIEKQAVLSQKAFKKIFNNQ